MYRYKEFAPTRSTSRFMFAGTNGDDVCASPVFLPLVHSPLLQRIHFVPLYFFFFIPFHFLGAPVSKPLRSKDQLPLTHAPIDATVDLDVHGLYLAVVPIDREVKVMWLALLTFQTHKLARILGMLREFLREF